MIGTGIVLIPTAIWQLLNENPQGAAFASVTYVACIAARELLEPRLLGAQIGLPPVLMLLSVYAGVKVFGAGGIFLTVVYSAVYRRTAADFLQKLRLFNSHQVLQLRETPLCTGADRAVIQNNLAGAAIQRADMRSVYQAGFVTEKKKALVEFGERFIQSRCTGRSQSSYGR